MLFKVLIGIGLVFVVTGAVIAAPSDNITTILQGAVLCWIALPFFWFASKVQHR